MLLMLRGRRVLFAVAIAAFPALIPIAIAYAAPDQRMDDGGIVFARLMDDLYLIVLAPLFALFFAALLISEEIEQQTIAYVLIRPMPRSAYLAGRFLAFMLVASAIYAVSLGTTYASATILHNFGFSAATLILAAHYLGVGLLALAAYGGVSLLIGAMTRRPIVYGAVLFFGWQRAATIVPGLVDFITVQKYVESMQPRLASERENPVFRDTLLQFEREIFLLDASTAAAVLIGITLAFLCATVLVLRYREFPTAQAIGD